MSAVLEEAAVGAVTARATSKVRVAVISINYAPELTGIAVYTSGMAEHMAQKGLDVTVHTGFAYYPTWSKAPQDEWLLHRRERVRAVKIHRNYLYVPQKPSALHRILHECSFVLSASLSYLFTPRADYTIIVSPPMPLGLPLLLLARLKRSRTLFHVQDLQPDAAVELGMLKPGFLTKALYALERLTYQWFDQISTISLGMRDKILSKGVPAEKIILFRNWANDSDIVPMGRNTALREEWGLSDRFVVLYSGNMGVKQGLGSLLDAAAHLRNHKKIVFLIVGDGGEKTALLERAEREGLDNVVFKRLQPAQRLGELLATADVAVIPQRAGVNDLVLPSKLNNILASGRPVIAAAAAGSELARIVRRADCGEVVLPENGQQIEEAILRLIDDPDRCARLGAAGRTFVERYLSQKSVLDRFCAQYFQSSMLDLTEQLDD